jgi:ubiquinone/menaquinone biosynthesis C-methylase UbiE
MKNIRKVNNIGEGNKLVKSYTWFNDIEVIRNFLDSIEEIAKNLPAEINILGIGSGVGNLEYATKSLLEERYNKKVNLTITDKITKDVLKSADVNILNVDNKRLPFKKNTFDLVIARSVTHYEKTKDDELVVLNEVNRVLRDEGYFITEAPYLSTQIEAKLLYEIHLLVSKPMNLKTYEQLLQLHKKTFKNVMLARSQPKKPLTVQKENFIKRYGVSGEIINKILELIKNSSLEKRPNVWEDKNNFGWKVSYAILICKK